MWPSKNVARGGIFQNATVNYSPETSRFLKTLINESKMTTFQRNKLNYTLRSGEPLPSPSAMSLKRSSTSNAKYPKVLIRPGSSKRRSLDSILQSGAYDRDRFTPTIPRVDREAAKLELQDKMAYGKNLKGKPMENNKKKNRRREEKEVTRNRFEEIQEEIKEREEWLKEMEEIGEGDKYRLLINQQIQERIREMERMQISGDH